MLPVTTWSLPGLIIDTHGQNTIEPVWDLLAEAYRCFGVFPTLVERDSNIPPLVRVTDRSGTDSCLAKAVIGIAEAHMA